MNQTIQTNVVTQMKDDYLAYSMAVITGRAIPDLYDGLRPATRRILQTMIEQGLHPEKPFVKCARICGMTTAWYHTHGSPYGSLIDMAAEWKNNVPWVWAHGNVGSSVDGAASERYVEAKLRPAAVDILLQNRETWETRDNYDASRQEAIRFNSVLPTVLLNGVEGIGVGLATRVAPHNLRSIVEATKLANKPKSSPADLKKAKDLLIPDFPTGCDVVHDAALDDYKQTGSGSIRCTAKVERGVQKRDGRAKDRDTFTFTHLPPYANPEKIGQQIKDALEKGKFEGVAEVVDESDLSGDRVVVIAKPGINAASLEQHLYAFTDLDSRFSAKTLVIDGTKPVELSPVELCQKWFAWRMDRLEEQFRHEQNQKMARLEIVMGFLKAIDKLDAVIKVIRAAKTPKEAIVELVSNRTLKFTSDQARAILEMKLRQLTNLDTDELIAENAELDERLAELAVLIKDKDARTNFCFKQMDDVAKRHGEVRRSRLIDAPTSPAKPHVSGEKRAATPAKPRLLKIDLKLGIIEQTKTVKGSLPLERSEKLVVVGENGMFKKLPSSHKGGVFAEPTKLVLAKREADIAERKYLVVFKLEGALKAMVLAGADLAKTTSSGKRWLPEGAELVHFGESAYTVKFISARKKPVALDLKVKAGRPGGKGLKVAALEELAGG